ncbi:MAG: serine/threonine protein kinase, partial [Chloroflexi bacterium]|nr:serine/threonine protein kinase [Chloroflexota bacterium]
MTLAVGDTVGPYRIMDQLGQGGMATVYKAYHANLDRYVAMKVLHPAFKEDPGFLERFKREARIVARLEHPNIVPIYDYADFEGQPYLIMKFIDGETLKARLKQQTLTLPETLKMLETVAGALTYAHEEGILHRDIKPSNLMLDRHGMPYIADFGLARIAQVGESTLSQDMMLGTPQYISPEQAKGVYDLGPTTDIYSLGVVMYEIMVGRVPFNADTPYAIIHDHIYKALPLPSKVNPQVPAEVERVLLRALAKEPEGRFSSAIDMVSAFRKAVEEAGMTELSAARYRPAEVQGSSSAATIPPDAVSPTPSPAYVMIPSPILSTTNSTLSKEAVRRRANLWILGGFGGLLLTCLGSLFIIVNAISDPDSRPWEMHDQADAAEEEDQVVIPLPGPFEGMGEISLNPDEMNFPVDPEDPGSFVTMVTSQMDAANPESMMESLSYAITTFNIPSETVLAGARRMEEQGKPDVAAWLYLEALTHEAVTPQVRDQAGEALFTMIEQSPAEARAILSRFAERDNPNALTYTLYALTLLEGDRSLTTRLAGVAIESALEVDDSFAE